MKRNLIISFLLLVIISLSSCINNFLEIEPQSDLPQSKFWKTESDLNFALNGAYSQLQITFSENQGISYLAWFVVRGDDFIGGNAGSRPPLLDMSLNKIPSGHLTTNWNGWYKVIGITNYALYYIPKMTTLSESKKNIYISEASFLRAYCYFNLARIWGDVPLVLNPTLVPEDAIKPFRTTHKKVMEQVVKDLDIALEKASKKSSDIVIERGNLGAIYALYTHVCMWNHTPADYDKAIIMAQSLYDLNKFNLEPVTNYKKIFTTGKTQENIWTLQWSFAANGYNPAVTEMCKAYDVSFGMTKALRSIWEDQQYVSDLRRRSTIDTIDNVVSKFPADYIIKKMPNAALRKWVDSDDPRTFLVTNTTETPLILFRLADIILLKAEAHNKRKEFDKALVELNKIRLRAKISPKLLINYNTDETLRINAIENDILQERRLELMGENARVFDLMRTGKLMGTMNRFYDTEISVSAPTLTLKQFESNEWYLPVYESNIIENENLLAQPTE